MRADEGPRRAVFQNLTINGRESGASSIPEARNASSHALASDT
jgi:hypothetical protein